ncbi:hypothetical protein EWM64_g4794 [Hericium alpestre]|uniref:Cytochrome P450 n=1 Tax=Hericium alpestre TaxID=135208 RepID=A0A4Y9ZWM5_9AGAM|nr:hypothetical protein EWM64_g4794 [Hericium alpestre]
MTPGIFLADTFPLLKYVPDWFPGAGWKRKAKEWRTIPRQGVALPHEYAKQQMQAGTAIPSFTSMYLEQENMTTEDKKTFSSGLPTHSWAPVPTRKFLHDKKAYKDPFEFRPERFLPSENHEPERDPRYFAFGFGRRICPGLLLADSSLFITFAMVLLVFNISKAVENGVPITPKQEFVDGIVQYAQLLV